MLLPFLVLQAAAFLSACLLARRSPTHRPYAWLLFAWTAATWVCVLLASAYPGIVRPPDPSLPPLTGSSFLAFQVYTTCQLLWPIGLAVASIQLCTADMRCGCCFPAWLASACLLVGCPGLTGDALRLNLLGVRLICLGVVAVAACEHYWRRATTTAAHHCMLLSALAELGVTVAGPWRLGLWGQWPIALIGYSCLLATITIYQGVLIWIRSARPTSTPSS